MLSPRQDRGITVWNEWKAEMNLWCVVWREFLEGLDAFNENSVQCQKCKLQKYQVY